MIELHDITFLKQGRAIIRNFFTYLTGSQNIKPQ